MPVILQPDELSPLERLCLRAGQLAFPGPGKEARAVGLALAMLVDAPGEYGLIGQGMLPDGVTLRETAIELVDGLDLSRRGLIDALEVLRVSGYLECDLIEPGITYLIRPCTLPQRRTHPYDRIETSPLLGRDTDLYGFGAH